MLTIKTKHNVLLYKDKYDNIKEVKVMKTDKKMKVKEAKEYLINNHDDFKMLVTVFFKDMNLYIPKKDIKKYIRK